jgi:hypothetical protein
MTLEGFIRSEAQGCWSFEVCGIAPGYLKVRIGPDEHWSAATEYWLVGNVLLEEPPELPRPPEEFSPYILLDTESIGVEAVAA